MTTRIVHCKDERFDVYIGRERRVEPGVGRPTDRGYWGNPYVIHTDLLTRSESIALYIEWLHARPYLIEQAVELLTDKTLGCWCKPKACHGDILVQICESAKNNISHEFW